MSAPTQNDLPDPDAADTGLRSLPSWRGVYGVVMMVFALLLLAMWCLERYYA